MERYLSIPWEEHSIIQSLGTTILVNKVIIEWEEYTYTLYRAGATNHIW